ncbi:hypothetical protein KE622_18435 [Shewanella algae]|uniref:hypothetical protein n=2 Tax=Shewanella TaxID=22 RepID=UPI00118402D6|nr:hypothetical protein [Shewanella algae]QXP19723.1 hypothetical protein KE621_02030 [Shewanella algae]QXP29339.1 hypothetical protein KE622_18435 [Shewanella algae]QXP33662.1 hypothetical protein KE623_18765 [Shewanella algae]QXP38506.1 hypothetical protein KE624_01660 [Shewanella algae]HDS1205339.1 hypothetical protein [Shewanella algae]
MMDIDIQVEKDGETFDGYFTFSGNMITVYYEGDYRSTQIDGAAGNIDSLAKQMLRGLVYASKSKKNS